MDTPPTGLQEVLFGSPGRGPDPGSAVVTWDERGARGTEPRAGEEHPGLLA